MLTNYDVEIVNDRVRLFNSTLNTTVISFSPKDGFFYNTTGRKVRHVSKEVKDLRRLLHRNWDRTQQEKYIYAACEWMERVDEWLNDMYNHDFATHGQLNGFNSFDEFKDTMAFMVKTSILSGRTTDLCYMHDHKAEITDDDVKYLHDTAFGYTRPCIFAGENMGCANASMPFFFSNPEYDGINNECEYMRAEGAFRDAIYRRVYATELSALETERSIQIAKTLVRDGKMDNGFISDPDAVKWLFAQLVECEQNREIVNCASSDARHESIYSRWENLFDTNFFATYIELFYHYNGVFPHKVEGNILSAMNRLALETKKKYCASVGVARDYKEGANIALFDYTTPVYGYNIKLLRTYDEFADVYQLLHLDTRNSAYSVTEWRSNTGYQYCNYGVVFDGDCTAPVALFRIRTTGYGSNRHLIIAWCCGKNGNIFPDVDAIEEYIDTMYPSIPR